jgi:hypothetical protein
MNDDESEASTDALIDEDTLHVLSFSVSGTDDTTPLHFISEKMLNTVRRFSESARRNALMTIALCDRMDQLMAVQPEETPVDEKAWQAGEQDGGGEWGAT